MKLRRVYQKHGAWYAVDDLPELNPKTGKPVQKWTKLCRVDAGEVALLEALAKLRGQVPQAAGNLPARLAEFQREYLPTLKNISVRKEYGRIYALVAKAFEEFDTEQVTSSDVADFLAADFAPRGNTNETEPRKLTLRSRNVYKSRISTFFAWCCGPKRYASVNPCRQFTIKRTRSKKIIWTPAQFHAIRDAFLAPGASDTSNPQGAMMQCYMDLTFLLYQRNTEVRRLERAAVDRKAGVLRFVPAKTDSTTEENVTVPLTPTIRRVIDRAQAIARDAYGLHITKHVICKSDGEPYVASGIRANWDRACRRAGVEGLTSKSLRNYAAQEAKRKGYSKEEIQVALAHSLITTTEGYLAAHAEKVSVIELELPSKPAGAGDDS